MRRPDARRRRGDARGKLTAHVSWQLEHGAGAEKERETFTERGREPPAYLFPPPLLPGAADWLEAFWELSTDRRFSGGPIPHESLARWPVAPDEAATFRHCIRAMDDAFRSFQAKPPESRKAMTPEMFSAMAERKLR